MGVKSTVFIDQEGFQPHAGISTLEMSSMDKLPKQPTVKCAVPHEIHVGADACEVLVHTGRLPAGGQL